jgi:two-component system phosphate regulon response regulator PhoB
VEDDDTVARVLGIILGRAGHRVMRAANLAEARRALEHERPTVILLDMKLPDGSGLDLLDDLSETPELQQLPVVVLSGVDPTFDPRLKSDRIVEWLMKPFAERELLRALRDATGGDRSSSPSRRRSA